MLLSLTCITNNTVVTHCCTVHQGSVIMMGPRATCLRLVNATDCILLPTCITNSNAATDGRLLLPTYINNNKADILRCCEQLF